MHDYPADLEEMIEQIRRLPGVGRRSAERMALAMLKWPADNLRAFGGLIGRLPESLVRCPVCGNLTGDGEECPICSDPGRDRSLICVVEDLAQLYTVEKSGSFRGLYHILGGKLSPLDNRTEADLNLESLTLRIASGGVKELIIALGSDVESRGTSYFLAEKYRGRVEKITVPAQGLPAGASLNYADGATIAAALSHRQMLD